MPARKSKKPVKAAAQKPKKKLTGKQEAFSQAYVETDFNGVQSAKKAGYKGNDATLAVVAHENLRKPKIAEKIREHLTGLKASPDEVLFVLGDHLRADLADLEHCFTDEGDLDLNKAKQLGVSHLIKKVRRTTRTQRSKSGISVKTFKIEIEMADAFKAAALLADIHGLKQLPKENATDAAARRAHAEAQLNKLMSECGFSREAAVEFLQRNAPNTARWLM